MPRALCAVLLLRVFACHQEPEPDPKLPRVVFLTQSAGFRHSVVTRPGPSELSLAERQLTEALRGIARVECTQDASRISLADARAVVFFTSGEVPVDVKALGEFVRAGGGFVGIHSATDTLAKDAVYGEMIGARFDGHPWHQKVRVKVEDPSHPAAAHLGDAFEIHDEIYQMRDWDRAKVKVVLSLDTASVDLKLPGVQRTDGDFALAWCRAWGEGRVFYTALGHREEVWQDERFLKHVAGAVRWAMTREPKRGDTVFNGRDFDGFRFVLRDKDADPAKTFRVENGAIVCTGRPTGYMVTERSYALFAMKFEWRYARPADLKDDGTFGGNSGTLLYIQDHKVWPRCVEVQGMYRDAGAIIPLGCKVHFTADRDARKRARKPVGEWNAMEIVSEKGRITVTLNGTSVATVEECELRDGPIGFQSEGAEIQWRAIEIRAR